MKIRDAYITCRTPSTTAGGWHHIYPRGEFGIQARIKSKSEDIVLVLDDEAFNKIIAAFREEAARPNFGGILVAQEHFADMPDKSSEAAAWIKTLEIREDGLWGRYDEVTDLGETLIGKRYKFRSPVSDIERIAGGRWRPVNLDSVGLTNKPKFKQLAVALGRDGQTQEEETEVKEKLIEMLKLGADAGEAAISARVQQAIDAETRLAVVEKELGTVKAEVLAREADAFVETHKERIADPAAVKKQYIAASDTTIALFAGMRVPAAAGKGAEKAARVLSREQARDPQASLMDGGDEAQAAEARVAARISARAAELKASGACRTLSEAYTKAGAEIQTQ